MMGSSQIFLLIQSFPQETQSSPSQRTQTHSQLIPSHGIPRFAKFWKINFKWINLKWKSEWYGLFDKDQYKGFKYFNCVLRKFLSKCIYDINLTRILSLNTFFNSMCKKHSWNFWDTFVSQVSLSPQKFLGDIGTHTPVKPV